VTLEEPSDGELAWLDTQLDAARALARGLTLGPPTLDLLLARAPRPLPDVLGHAYGAALGEHLVDRLGYRWRAADDGFLVRLVVEGPDHAGSPVVDPFELVWRAAGGGPTLDDAWRSLRAAIRGDVD
jgi:hypothetical protein